MVKRRAFTSLAPIITLFVMLVLPWCLPNRPTACRNDLWTAAAAQSALEALPTRAGDWQSVSVELPRPAAPLLGAAATLGRRYASPSGDWIELFVVQCADVRDLLGHYPSACYPSVGWQEFSREESELMVGDRRIPIRVYGFSRPRGAAMEERIHVLSTFVLPDGRCVTDLDVVRSRVRDHVRDGNTGEAPVGQIQLVSPSRVSLTAARRDAEQLLSHMPDLLNLAGESRGHADG